jgi:hypothetical protein
MAFMRLGEFSAKSYVGDCDPDNFGAVSGRARICDHIRVRTLRIGLQSAADRIIYGTNLPGTNYLPSL